MAIRDSASRATLNSVAERAGVSRQTVSNVLHRPEVVQPDTRERVEAAITELDYRPHLAARQMRTARSQAIAVRILPTEDGVASVVLDRFVHALCGAAELHGYHLVVFTAPDDDAEITAYRDLRRSLDIDGFVVVGTHIGDRRVDWLLEQEIPFVAFGRPWLNGDRDETAAHDWVDVDGAAGTYQATRALLERGHRTIAFFGWDDSAGVGDDRMSGWDRALTEAGISERVLLRGPNSLDSGAAAVAELSSDHPEVTAAVCVSDAIAIGAVQALAGKPLELIGFDNTAAAQLLGLSSITQPLADVAARCFDLLHDQLTAGPGQHRPQHVLLTPELELR